MHPPLESGVVGRRQQAAEVLQETMLKVLDRIGDFRGFGSAGENRSPFWGWLRQIAINEALMALRRNRRSGDWLDLADGPEPIDDITPPPAAAADAARLQRALDALPPTTRAVLWLYHAEGYTHEEIAESSSSLVLDQYAASSAASWTFRPARRGDKDIPLTVRIPVRFMSAMVSVPPAPSLTV